MTLEHDRAWAREQFPEIPWAEEFVIHMPTPSAINSPKILTFKFTGFLSFYTLFAVILLFVERLNPKARMN